MSKETFYAVLFIVFFLLALGVVGEMDYQDEVAVAGGRK